ncbi:DEKNAAC102214 [Brettanomyces naardenensis]|uniref:DEKNAAC102214 n=1 Tax=Brettanomyces naardenensis TaxID=13370 RepID=A0A448YL27_BRENA|nr:DEKNAAC102214 [Brettanomyces naardenensis]
MLLLPALATAFVPLTPSYVNNHKAFSVSSKQKPPSSYLSVEQVAQKDAGSEDDSSSSTSTSTPATVTLDQGSTFIFSDPNEEAFYVNADIGSSQYPLLIDTGSPYLWVYDSDCDDGSCDNKPLYSVSPSQTSTTTSTFELAYNTGTASGVLVEDDVTIADCTAKNFSFGAASSVPDIFQNYSFSGILGLSANATVADPSGKNGRELDNIVDYLHKKGSIDAGKFALCMGKYPVTPDNGNAGLLLLGDTTANQQGLYLDPVYEASILNDSSNHWEVKIDEVFVDNYQASFQPLDVGGTSSNTSRIGLLDSGTTSIILSSKDAMTLHSYFPASISDGTQYAVFCNSTLTVSLQIAGHNWTITPSQYLGQPYGADSSLDGYCVSNFQGLDSTRDGSWILGNIFLRKYYVEFDYDHAKVGLAERNAGAVVLLATTVEGNTLPASSPTSSAGSSYYNVSYSLTSTQSRPQPTSNSSSGFTATSNSSSTTSISKGGAGNFLPSWTSLIPLLLTALYLL